MKSSPNPKPIAIAIIEEIEEERLLWLIVSFLQGLLSDD